MRFLYKLSLFSVFGLALGSVFPAEAALNRARFTYEQAARANGAYFQLLSRYRGAIDIVDEQGDTAYCIALKEGNQSVQRFLISQGASVYHRCVQKMNKANQRQMKSVLKQQSAAKDSGSYKPYLWAGAGVLAIGGGVALAAGGGGGGHHDEADTGDDSRPNQPGEPVGDTPLPKPDPEGNLKDNSADVFKTEEYTKGNFLEGIKAAEAYRYIYRQDDNGNFFGHQAGSDEALKQIKVGVLDSGVYANEDIKGKVTNRYDLNRFSKGASIWTWSREDGRVQAYVVKKDSKYYLFHVHHEWSDTANGYVDILEPIWRGADGYYNIGIDPSMAGQKLDWAIDESIVNDLMKAAWNITLADMSLVNAGAGFPGIDISELNPNATVREIFYDWLQIGDISHGTHVAGVIAAKKNDKGMHGVAFDNAEILGASWDMYSGSNIYNTVKQMVDDGASVINNSWGADFGVEDVHVSDISREGYKRKVPKIWDSYVYAAKNGAVWVQATGNGITDPTTGDVRYDQPQYYVGMGAVDLSQDGYKKSDIAVPYLAVAALDPATKSENAVSGELAWYSNVCGSAAGYCLAAPGTEILSTIASKNGNVYMSGTSMATPVVSGSIALLNGYYPWLNAQNIAYLLLETANKDGVYNNSSIYGQGALDLEAAVTTPIGDLRLPESASLDSLSSARATKLSLSQPLQKQMLKAMPETITAFDALDRPFQYETKKLMNTTHASNANLRNAVSKMAMGGVTKTVTDEKSGFQFTTQDSLNNGGVAHLSSAEVVNQTDTAASRFYYVANSKYQSSDNVLKASLNPYLAMNEAYGAEHTLKLSDTSKLKLSLQTGENGLYERDFEQDKHSFNERSYALWGEYSFNMTDYLEVAALGGMLFENDAVLGMNGAGAFGLKDSSTYYMGVKAALNLTADFSILAAYYRGYTQGGEASMLSVSDLQTESFMLAGEYKLNKTNKIGLSLSSPLSVVRGKASVLFARGRDNHSDTVYMQKLTSSLKPEAKEYDLGMYYQGQPKENVNLLGKVEARFNADGEKGVTDYIGIVGAGVAF